MIYPKHKDGSDSPPSLLLIYYFTYFLNYFAISLKNLIVASMPP